MEEQNVKDTVIYSIEMKISMKKQKSASKLLWIIAIYEQDLSSLCEILRYEDDEKYSEKNKADKSQKLEFLYS